MNDRYALIDDADLVVNVIIYDGISPYETPENVRLVRLIDESTVSPGDTYPTQP